MGISKEDFKAMQDRVNRATGRPANPTPIMDEEDLAANAAKAFEPVFNAVPSTDEQKLNKTEKAYLAHLRRLAVPFLGIQNITLKLADDCRFTPDFTYVNENGRYVFVDVKGFQREDALLKIKFAARTFTQFDFVIVKKNGTSWDVTPVKP